VNTGAAASGRPVPILVVLPSPPVRFLAVSALHEVLSRMGRSAAVVETGSAFEALWLLARLRPALALVALDLPLLSGDELVALMRSRPEHQKLPVVAVAPLSDLDAPRRAADSGAAALLRTPFDADAVATALTVAGIPGGTS
jgi:CheY-like chemotaxis protein